jgi:hypothetical protein
MAVPSDGDDGEEEVTREVRVLIIGALTTLPQFRGQRPASDAIAKGASKPE